MTNKQKMKILVDKLNLYRDNYYNDIETISDTEYDLLIEELKNLEKELGYVLPNSPNKEVGYTPNSKLKRVKHPYKLLSLDKLKSIDGFYDFAKKSESLLMLKYDGLTCKLVYKNGKLQQASTRGNGEEGEDITHNSQFFKNVPRTINYKGRLVLTGEAIIDYDTFKKINSTLDKPYKNARGLASGSVRLLSDTICKERNVTFMPFDILDIELSLTKRSEFFEFLKSQGFTNISYLLVNKSTSFEDFTKQIELMKEFSKENGIPIDGMVSKYNDVKYSKSLGATSHHYNDGMAYKFEDETQNTVLRAINWQIGQTGTLTPVGVFDNVEIDGTDVSKATLHNVSMIEELNLQIGDRIKVRKANMIIPQIVENIDKNGTKEKYTVPTICPYCHSKLQIKENNGVKTLICSSDNCIGSKIQKFSRFVSREGCNIDGVSISTLTIFLNNGYIKEFKDLYCISKHKDEILSIDSFGNKKYLNLLQSIEKSRKIKLSNFITALSIPNVGKSKAKLIEKHCKNFEDFIEKGKNNFNWTVIEDFGDIISKSINEYVNINYLMIAELAKEYDFEEKEKDNISPILAGKTLVATGSFKGYTRDSIKETIEKFGGKANSSVSKKTDFVITGEKAGSKLTKAKELGIPIITEEQFNTMIS